MPLPVLDLSTGIGHHYQPSLTTVLYGYTQCANVRMSNVGRRPRRPAVVPKGAAIMEEASGTPGIYRDDGVRPGTVPERAGPKSGGISPTLMGLKPQSSCDL
jgi:hypothetical protein